MWRRNNSIILDAAYNDISRKKKKKKKANNQHKGDSFENLVFKKLNELIKNQNVSGVSRYNDIFCTNNMPAKLHQMSC